MSDEAKSLDELAGLLVVSPKGNAEADEGIGSDENDNSDELETLDGAEDGNSADAETDDAGADEGDENGEGDEAEAEGGPTGDEPKVTVKIDGKDVEVTLAEAIAGYQRGADYTRKTQEVSESRKAIDTELAQVRTHRDQYANVLKVLQERLGDPAKEPTHEQWETLRREDPDQFTVEWADYQRRSEQRATIRKEQERVDGEKQAETVKVLREHIGQQRELLLAVLPEWKEPAKAEAGMKAIRTYAKTVGFTDDDLNGAYDHRMIVAVDKARRFDELMAKRATALRKLKAAPEMPAPGARQQPKDTKADLRKAAKAKLAQTGSLDDALPLMFK